MPTIPLSDFDEAPDVGDKVIVKGKVLSIDEDTEEVEVSYDEVTIKDYKKSKKHKNYNDNNDGEDTVYVRDNMTVDDALARSFPAQQTQGPGPFQG